jgi:glyoxylase-like metal-dependent hydrolase (beta-lactamase superfamily II)
MGHPEPKALAERNAHIRDGGYSAMVAADIHLVDRGTLRADANFALEGQTTASASDPNPDAEIIESAVYNLLIDHPDGTLLWDTGSHPDARDGYWPAELYDAFEHYDAHERDLGTALGEIGYVIEDIDVVVQSHLHPDHAGSLYRFADTDVPVFVHREELKYAYYSVASGDGDPAYLRADFDHDLDWRVLHRDRETHFEDIEFVHLPGHTPGLVGMMIHLDNDGTVLFAGDELFVRRNYENEQPLGGGLLWSKREWFDSLRLLKELERRHDATVFCGHDTGDVERLRDGLS